jgi:hypothetical protein
MACLILLGAPYRFAGMGGQSGGTGAVLAMEFLQHIEVSQTAAVRHENYCIPGATRPSRIA